MVYCALFPAGFLYAFLLASVARGADATWDIKVDQAGYLPKSPKMAAVLSGNKDVARFRVLRSQDNATVLEGTLGKPVSDPDSGDAIRQADFSELRQSGKFYIQVP